MAKQTKEAEDIVLEDQFPVSEEDDFEFGEKKEEGKEKEEKKEEEKKEEEKAKSDEDDGSDDFGKKDEKEDTAGEAEDSQKEDTDGKKAEGKEEEEEPDLFVDEAEKSDEQEKFDFNEVATELGIKDKTDETKFATKADFVDAVKKKMDESKQELDLSKFSTDAQKVIEHLSKENATLETFFENPVITSMNQMLAMSQEEKVRNLRYQELLKEHKGDEEKVEEELAEEFEEYSKGDIKSMAEEIDKQALEIRANEIKKIIGDVEKNAEQSANKAAETNKKERENLVNYVNKQTSFFGIPLTDKAKASILSDINKGAFDEEIAKTPEATKFFSYMAAKHGQKIVERYNAALKDENRKGYNKAQDKEFKALHKIPDEKKQSAGAGKKAEQEGTKKGFDAWTDTSIFGEQ